jgi:hypothetical protein
VLKKSILKTTKKIKSLKKMITANYVQPEPMLMEENVSIAITLVTNVLDHQPSNVLLTDKKPAKEKKCSKSELLIEFSGIT